MSDAESGHEYQPLDLSKDEIRLLTLHPGRDGDKISCTLSHHNLTDNIEYEALSYTWGDNANLRTIILDGLRFQVTANLETALRHLRYPPLSSLQPHGKGRLRTGNQRKDRVLWIDALCINQSDNVETSQQVAIMAEIYSHASRVPIWLGEETEDVRDAFATIKRALSYFPPESEVEGNPDQRLAHTLTTSHGEFGRLFSFNWIPLGKLLARAWFQRKWVIQEVAHAREALLMCGHQTLPWDSIADLTRRLHSFSMTHDVSANLGNANDQAQIGYQHVIVMRAFRGFQEPDGSPIPALLDLLLLARQFKCTDPRDHIFAIHSFSSERESHEHNFPIDYTQTTEETYRRFAAWSIFGKSSLRLLSVPTDPSQQSELSLPSWVPDFTRLDQVNPLILYEVSPYNATAGTSPIVRLSHNNSILHTSGKAIDRVHILGSTFEDTKLYPGTTLPKISDPNRATRLRRQQLWLLECEDIALGDDMTMSPQRFEEFWRTMLCDAKGLPDIHERATAEYTSYFLQFCEVLHAEPGEKNSNWYKDRLQGTIAVEQSLHAHAGRRRFCATSGGRLGHVPRGTAVGDLICVFYGGSVPYVIRPVDNGFFTFVGECYVHGLMDGEAMEIEGLQEQEFALR
ncbi:HET-domain-containing protein [Lentithecium fluviatile CBS 122367]|uniref:HET-domain-containing protein n=1 Tax=Lentithecium fluviatile CBS 122367 TaxID=1168545 RepID=A0A6G1JD65_9PLEO|nr:HET-domain-containing protein [Lentithecium fluviatile CBS 122367]